MKEFIIFSGTSWQSNDYCSEGHFDSVHQISCNSNSEAHDFY